MWSVDRDGVQILLLLRSTKLVVRLLDTLVFTSRATAKCQALDACTATGLLQQDDGAQVLVKRAALLQWPINHGRR